MRRRGARGSSVLTRSREGTATRWFVTGTDTDVGKTIATAALARALVARAEGARETTIVKLVQTGLSANDEGDAHLAARLAGCAALELARYPLPADPWNAALDAGLPPPSARALARQLAALEGDVVAEGSGGAAVPLNERESIADVAVAAELRAMIVVGLRLGCINHALLTAEYLTARGIPIVGAVFVERFGPVEAAYRAHVERGLRERLRLLGTLPYEQDLARAVAHGAEILAHIGDLERT